VPRKPSSSDDDDDDDDDDESIAMALSLFSSSRYARRKFVSKKRAQNDAGRQISSPSSRT
jgi:hypothetical protein